MDEAAKSPKNQAIIAEIRKTDRQIDDPVLFYYYADRLEGVPDPKDFGYGDSKKIAGTYRRADRNLALHKHYASLPHRDTGTYLKLTHGTGRVIVAPKEMPPGNYVMRVRVGVVEGTPASRRFIQVGHPQRQIGIRDWGLEGRAISSHQVVGTIDDPEVIEIPLEVGTNTPKEVCCSRETAQQRQISRCDGVSTNTWKKENRLRPPACYLD